MEAKQCLICNQYYLGDECVECKDKKLEFIDENMPDIFKTMFGGEK